MTEGSIQRLFLLLIFTVITVGIQYFLIKIVVKHSIKKQILLNAFISILWITLAFYSVYKDYRNLFFYVSMGFVICFTIVLLFIIKGHYYDSRKIAPKHKKIIAIGGFVAIILSWLRVIGIYSFLSIIAIILLLIHFIDYKNYSNYYDNDYTSTQN